jgi:hypothetical protein
MKQIIKLTFGYSHLKNAEHYQYNWFNIRFLTPRMAAIPQLFGHWESYKIVFVTEETIFKRNYKFGETDEISIRDRVRDGEFILLGKTLLIEMRSIEPERVAAAKLIYRAYINYKGAHTKSLHENTALMTNFSHDMEDPIMVAALELLGLTTIVNRIRTENTAIADLIEQRGAHVIDMKAEGTMGNARVAVDKSGDLFIDAVNAFYAMNELTTKDPVLRGKLEEIIDAFNNHIEQTSVVYARRTGRKVKKGANNNEPETPNTPEPPAPSGPLHFEMVNQMFFGDHPSFNGNATHMSAEAVEAAAFAAALIPAAEGATLRMYTGYENYFTDFPIESLQVTIDGGSPVPGLVITTPNANTAFFPQIPDRPEEAVEVIKDGQILATIAGVIRPSSVGEG